MPGSPPWACTVAPAATWRPFIVLHLSKASVWLPSEEFDRRVTVSVVWNEGSSRLIYQISTFFQFHNLVDCNVVCEPIIVSQIVAPVALSHFVITTLSLLHGERQNLWLRKWISYGGTLYHHLADGAARPSANTSPCFIVLSEPVN